MKHGPLPSHVAPSGLFPCRTVGLRLDGGTWGDRDYVGLGALRLLVGPQAEALPLEGARVDCAPARDLRGLGYSDDPRVLDNLLLPPDKQPTMDGGEERVLLGWMLPLALAPAPCITIQLPTTQVRPRKRRGGRRDWREQTRTSWKGIAAARNSMRRTCVCHVRICLSTLRLPASHLIDVSCPSICVQALCGVVVWNYSRAGDEEATLRGARQVTITLDGKTVGTYLLRKAAGGGGLDLGQVRAREPSTWATRDRTIMSIDQTVFRAVESLWTTEQPRPGAG